MPRYIHSICSESTKFLPSTCLKNCPLELFLLHQFMLSNNQIEVAVKMGALRRTFRMKSFLTALENYKRLEENFTRSFFLF
jgi:hypothetical protein